MSFKQRDDPTKACFGKESFDTIRDANKQVKHLNKRSKVKKLKAYLCPHCSRYHYGHDQRRKMKHLTKPTFVPPADETWVLRDKNLKGEFNVKKYL